MKETIELHTVGIFRGKEYEMQELFNGLLEENQRLNNIIKEVREYIEKTSDNEYSYGDYEIHYEVKKELLEILDKVRE